MLICGLFGVEQLTCAHVVDIDLTSVAWVAIVDVDEAELACPIVEFPHDQCATSAAFKCVCHDLLLALVWLEVHDLTNCDELVPVAPADLAHVDGDACLIEPAFDGFVCVVTFDVGECATLNVLCDWCVEWHLIYPSMMLSRACACSIVSLIVRWSLSARIVPHVVSILWCANATLMLVLSSANPA